MDFIVIFCSAHYLREVGDWVLKLVFTLLGEDAGGNSIRGVCLNFRGLVQVPVAQDGGGG